MLRHHEREATGRRRGTVRLLSPAAVVLLVASVLAVPGPPSAWAHLPPVSDDFADATVLAGDSGFLVDETNVDSSAESGEPAHTSNSQSDYSYINFNGTLGETESPTVTVTEPVTLSTVSLPTAALGTATDNLGVAEVWIEVHDRDTGLWWNGAGWQAGCTYVSAALDTPGAVTTGWDCVFDPPAAANLAYWMTVRSVDTSNNTSPNAYINFTGT